MNVSFEMLKATLVQFYAMGLMRVEVTDVLRKTRRRSLVKNHAY